jgi:hypothetical protein
VTREDEVEAGWEGGLFAGAGRDEKWVGNELRIWAAHGEGKVGYRRERGRVGRKERIGPKGLGKKTLFYFQNFLNFKLIRFQSKFEFQKILVAT